MRSMKCGATKPFNDTYEPGSTFKSVVLASALEEGTTSTKDSFLLLRPGCG